MTGCLILPDTTELTVLMKLDFPASQSVRTGTSQKKPELGNVWRCHGYNFFVQLDKKLLIIKKIIRRKSIPLLRLKNNFHLDPINKMFFESTCIVKCRKTTFHNFGRGSMCYAYITYVRVAPFKWRRKLCMLTCSIIVTKTTIFRRYIIYILLYKTKQ